MRHYHHMSNRHIRTLLQPSSSTTTLPHCEGALWSCPLIDHAMSCIDALLCARKVTEVTISVHLMYTLSHHQSAGNRSMVLELTTESLPK